MYVDYDTYASMSPLRKNKVIGEITAENKAELVTAHWRRFLEANRARLNAAQIQFIEESIAYVRPDLYQHPRANEEEVRKHSEEMEARLRELFPFEDIVNLHMEAFKNSGVIRNPVALVLVRAKPQIEESEVENLRAALYDLATLPPDELRSRRYGDDDFPALFCRAFQGMPCGEEFFSLLSDADVPLAASRAYALISGKRKAGPGAPNLLS
jgi:hypothetical protein